MRGVAGALCKVRVVYDPSKDAENVRKHGLSLAVAEYLFDDPLLVIVYDRFENGEDRYHAVGAIGSKCIVLVHTYPDPDDEDWVRAISLREATRDERRRYEEEGLG